MKNPEAVKRPEFKDNNQVERMSSSEFRNNGFLAFVNTILHVFGVCICYDTKNDVFYPAYCKFRGFAEDSQTRMYTRLTQYMEDNASDLMKDLED